MLRLWRLWAGTWVEIDLAAERVVDLKLSIEYGSPARLRWSMVAPQQSVPFAINTPLALTDDSFAGLENPLFEGHLRDVAPASSQRLECLAEDATRWAAERVLVSSATSTFPAAVPRAVYNCDIENDDDHAFSLTVGATVGSIIETLLTVAAPDLVGLLAAPAIGLPYEPLDLAPLDFIPQSKIVFEGEAPTGAIDHLLRLYPQCRWLLHPGTRQWRVKDVTLSPAITLTLNDFSAGERRVLSMRLDRSLVDRASAVRICGPPGLLGALATTEDGSLEGDWTFTQELAFPVAGPGDPLSGNVARVWQVAEPSRRRMGRALPLEQQIPAWNVELAGQSLTYIRARTPTLAVTWDGERWYPARGTALDVQAGKVIAPWPLFRVDVNGHFVRPAHARFYFSYHDEPLSVRYPATGHEGSAYERFGIERELVLYDESLAIVHENYQSWTSAERLAEFAKLAQSIHSANKDVIHAGGCVLEGIDYEFLRLDRRVNLAAVDDAGADLTTGWEDINAIVTGVEYDFADQTTLLTFDGDRGSFAPRDTEELKRQLRLDARERPPSVFIITFDGGLFFQARSSPIPLG